MDKNYDFITFKKAKTFILKMPRVANPADITKIATMFIKATIKDSKKSLKVKNYALKCNLYFMI